MKIFITGSTGYYGTYLVERLLQANYELACFVMNTSQINATKR